MKSEEQIARQHRQRKKEIQQRRQPLSAAPQAAQQVVKNAVAHPERKGKKELAALEPDRMRHPNRQSANALKIDVLLFLLFSMFIIL